MNYYSDHLSTARLKLCYELAGPRIRQYLQAEMNYALDRIRPQDRVLELGCGYGRVLDSLAQKAKFTMGIDTSIASLVLAKERCHKYHDVYLAQMNAVDLGIADQTFDTVVCIQNGISAFHEDPQSLIRESLRITRPGGTLLFSSYSAKIWSERLEWFREQAKAGLLGEIDDSKTGNGIIVCKDGFSATTFTADDFLKLAESLEVNRKVIEIDESSLFLEMTKI